MVVSVTPVSWANRLIGRSTICPRCSKSQAASRAVVGSPTREACSKRWTVSGVSIRCWSSIVSYLHIQSKLLSRPVNRFFKKIFCGLDVISAHYPRSRKTSVAGRSRKRGSGRGQNLSSLLERLAYHGDILAFGSLAPEIYIALRRPKWPRLFFLPQVQNGQF